MAILSENIKTPVIPIDSYIVEAISLYNYALGDAAKLAVANITAERIQELLVRSLACQTAQAKWQKKHEGVQEKAKQWKELAPRAYDMRDHIIHAMYYVFRNNEEMLKQVRAIDEGNTNADMIQDLMDLALLGETHARLLNTVGISPDVLTEAKAMASQALTYLGEANGEQAQPQEELVIRNQAYTYLKEVVDEIRAAGKFVFWKDKEHAKLYASEYIREKNRKQAQATQE